jgi:5'-deoxynucleotidase YfbR-like HD superfamily hydrolase
MSWTQTLRGRAFDLHRPDPEMVDFAEIADTLSHLNRYAGATEKPVSVALHTLIAFDVAQPDDRAHVLLHDAHEAYIGEITAPTEHELAKILDEEIARQTGLRGAIFSSALASLKKRLDVAIFSAAGLSMPQPAQRNRIKFADYTALMTERRDFLARPPRPLAPEIECIKPLSKKYRLRAAPDVAAELLEKFNTYLPALRDRRAA